MNERGDADRWVRLFYLEKDEARSGLSVCADELASIKRTAERSAAYCEGRGGPMDAFMGTADGTMLRLVAEIERLQAEVERLRVP